MRILRTCPVTGLERCMEIQVEKWQLDHWRAGELIQNAMPQLSLNEREFIKTGIIPEVWEKLCNDEE